MDRRFGDVARSVLREMASRRFRLHSAIVSLRVVVLKAVRETCPGFHEGDARVDVSDLDVESIKLQFLENSHIPFELKIRVTPPGGKFSSDVWELYDDYENIRYDFKLHLREIAGFSIPVVDFISGYDRLTIFVEINSDIAEKLADLDYAKTVGWWDLDDD